MGCLFLSCSVFVLALLFKPLASQNLNSDGFFISEFLKKMGFSPLESFNFSAPVCSWPKVICDSKGEYVVELAASGTGLSGPIPDTTIGKLGKLQSLDLSNNKITHLPADFWSLGSLKSLNLSSNMISGPLPNDIGNLGTLQSFDISGNNFSGQIPATISSLDAVRVLKFNRNNFEQSIPAGILKLRSIVLMDLSSNNLKGSLPHGFGAAFPELKSLNLAGNEIHGRDSDLSELNSVTSLNISGNFFQGSVMSLFKKNVEVMDLSRNEFQGHISQVESTSNYNWSSLVHLDLSENQLSGKIFHISNQAQNLKHLNLACNRFSRQEFPEIRLLFYLEYLNLSKTRLVLHLPDALSQLRNLKVLDLSWNNLSGRIPSLSVKNLQILDLSHNNFSGEIPEAILEKLPTMELFNFSFNNLTFCDSKIPFQTLQSAFFQTTNLCPIATNPNLFKSKSHKRHILKLALALILSVVFIFFLVGSLFLAIHCRRKTRKWVVKRQISFKEDQNISGPFSFNTDSTTWIADIKQATSVPVVIFEKPLFNITFADLLSATTNFDRGTLLAEGKFGPVYRGFLPGGIQVVMKILIHNSTLPDEEAAKELEYLGGIKHPNLVPLAGYCLAGDQRIAIFEYMENGNLQNLLHDLPLGHGIRKIDDWSADNWEEDENGIKTISTEGSLTSWRFRHKIALGTARALAFLHHGCLPPIIHRDVKASSIYLDSNLEPRLSDFGLAKVFGNNSRGPSGYDPPELSSPENAFPTQKTDVYCFGVVLLELMTGKKAGGDEYSDEREGNLVKWVRKLVRENQLSQAIDPKIIGTGNEEDMEECIKIGYLCTAETPLKRPSMQQIVGLLKDIEPSSRPFR